MVAQVPMDYFDICFLALTLSLFCAMIGFAIYSALKPGFKKIETPHPHFEDAREPLDTESDDWIS